MTDTGPDAEDAARVDALITGTMITLAMLVVRYPQSMTEIVDAAAAMTADPRDALLARITGLRAALAAAEGERDRARGQVERLDRELQDVENSLLSYDEGSLVLLRRGITARRHAALVPGQAPSVPQDGAGKEGR